MFNNLSSRCFLNQEIVYKNMSREIEFRQTQRTRKEIYITICILTSPQMHETYKDLFSNYIFCAILADVT